MTYDDDDSKEENSEEREVLQKKLDALNYAEFQLSSVHSAPQYYLESFSRFRLIMVGMPTKNPYFVVILLALYMQMIKLQIEN